MVENESGRNGVIYTNSDLALRMAQFNCKIGKMRGIYAFEMFYAVKEFGGLYIQSNYGHIHLNKAKVAEVMGKMHNKPVNAELYGGYEALQSRSCTIPRMTAVGRKLSPTKALRADAVGMPVTRHPPHRSQRALLTHWAPPSGINA